MSYVCPNCGETLESGLSFCTKCGAAVDPMGAQSQPSKQDLAVLQELSRRIEFESKLWVIIGVLQCISLVGIIAGTYNFITASKNKKYADDILKRPVGIYNAFDSLNSWIITLLLNVFLGSIVGIIGSVYNYMSVRDYVKKNKDAFDRLERYYK
ncbi:MAG: zinc-ribbon domain-containing protein [Clostridia bacterium]|nr:zinc-ribbon domain-containing protein [Clostridia bacterium]